MYQGLKMIKNKYPPRETPSPNRKSFPSNMPRPCVVDLRLGITADGSYVVVIREVVQCAFLNSERGAELVLSGPASKDLAQMLGMDTLDTAR